MLLLLLPPCEALRPLWRFRGWRRLLAWPPFTAVQEEEEALLACSRCKDGDPGASGFLCLRGELGGGGARLGDVTLKEATPLDLFPAALGSRHDKALTLDTDSLLSAPPLLWPDLFRAGEACCWAALLLRPPEL